MSCRNNLMQLRYTTKGIPMLEICNQQIMHGELLIFISGQSIIYITYVSAETYSYSCEFQFLYRNCIITLNDSYANF